jgi:hypothetical protein
MSDQVIDTNKNPACRDTFLGVFKVEKNISAPSTKVTKVARKNACIV